MPVFRKTWTLWVCTLLLVWTLSPATIAFARSQVIQFTDSSGATVVLSKPPERVVSLVPGITQTLFALGAENAVKGITWHDTPPPHLDSYPAIVGGFLAPSVEKIGALNPDVIFLSSLHTHVRGQLEESPALLIELQSNSLEDAHLHISLLGQIFQQQANAAGINERIRAQLELIAQKVERIPENERQRVIRFMGRDAVQAPGDDSFQNDFIRAAGGIPPQLGRDGAMVPISLEEWKDFNPQVVYGCNGDQEAAEALLNRPGWKDVDAVREGRILFFPGALACQASVHTGDFISWLSASIYAEAFSEPSNLVLEEKTTGSRDIHLPLDYVQWARVVESNLYDFPNKTLVVRFHEPMRILSTMEGQREGITTVGNHGTPPPCWSLGHREGLEAILERIFRVHGKSREESSLLLTGANMDNLAIGKAQFRDMAVYALVTAGVEGNAIRSGSDEGRYYEPGTINMILMTNMALSPRAMSRAVISATEAKSAALQDLDIRSRGAPLLWQATGTGTDEIIVVEGRGTPLDNAGGHSKLGELIARAVYDAVQEGVLRQNSLKPGRHVLSRLKERGITPSEMLGPFAESMQMEPADMPQALGMLEEILLDARYAAFVESALALSDAWERGQMVDLEAFGLWARIIAQDISGVSVFHWKEPVSGEEFPMVLRMAMNALLNGLLHKMSGENHLIGKAGEKTKPVAEALAP